MQCTGHVEKAAQAYQRSIGVVVGAVATKVSMSVTMIVTRATDGNLTQPAWKTLRDDRNLFVPKQAALLVQDSLLAALPAVRPALQELSKKIRDITAD